jgi:hypothetical protein
LWSVAATVAPLIALFVLTCGQLPARAQQFPAGAGWRDVSVVEYQLHLAALNALVASCQKQHSSPFAAQTTFPACDPAQVGPDDRVQWPSGAAPQSREVRYDWLRSVLARAAKKGGAAQPDIFGAIPGASSKPVSVDQLLSAALERLQNDMKQAARPGEANSDYAAERKSLNVILAQRAYQDATQVSARERFLEWFDNQLDKFFTGLWRFGARSPWIVWLLWGLLLVGLCAALVWLLLRIERRAVVRLVPDLAPTPGAPSAREWQLWLRDAQEMAAKGRWREAIHFLYWASIARLESRRLWPADRARTPREYLALLVGADPRKPGLTALTRSFERTWYGGREAAAEDFSAALELVRGLGVAVE